MIVPIKILVSSDSSHIPLIPPSSRGIDRSALSKLLYRRFSLNPSRTALPSTCIRTLMRSAGTATACPMAPAANPINSFAARGVSTLVDDVAELVEEEGERWEEEDEE